MSKAGIRILADRPGAGAMLQKGDRIELSYDLALNRGEVIQANQRLEFVYGDRDVIAGLRYGLAGMQPGGYREFKASPHLCYGAAGVPEKIPADAVLVFRVRLLRILG